MNPTTPTFSVILSRMITDLHALCGVRVDLWLFPAVHDAHFFQSLAPRSSFTITVGEYLPCERFTYANQHCSPDASSRGEQDDTVNALPLTSV